jgi:hypothetical protein
MFQDFPYLLPTLLGGVILVIGAIMACFLSWDGGVRGGSRIALPVEKDEPLNARSPSASPAPSSHTARPAPSLKPKRSVYLSPMTEPELGAPTNGYGLGTSHPRRDSRASLGTAYG